MTSTPEAPRVPDAGKNTGSFNFVNDPARHATDGVRPFNRDEELTPELVDKLEGRGVPEADVIDPLTLDVPVEKIDLSTPEPATETVETPVPAPASNGSDRIIPPAPATTETEGEPKKSRRGLWTGIGAAAAGATAAVALTLGFTGGGDEKVQAKPPEVSAPANEAEQPTPAAPEASEAVDPTENLEILRPAGTAPEALGDFANRISSVINARADGGGVESDNLDLQYLTNSTPATPNTNLSNFEDFVSNMTSNVLDIRAQAAERFGTVDIGVVSTYVDSEPTPDGGYIIEAVDEYWAIGEDGQSIGDIIVNDEPHRYTFSREDVLLPDGSTINTFVLTGFEPGSADPAKVLN